MVDWHRTAVLKLVIAMTYFISHGSLIASGLQPNMLQSILGHDAASKVGCMLRLPECHKAKWPRMLCNLQFTLVP